MKKACIPKLPISEMVIEKAIKYGNDCLSYEYNRFGLDNEKRLEKIIIGTIGELMFQSYLDNTPLSNKYEFDLIVGKYDEYDFNISGNKIDVKTSGFENNFTFLNLLYAVEPYERRKYDFVVKVFIDGYQFNLKKYNFQNIKYSYIAGFIPYDQIINFQKVNFGYAEDYKIPIKSLIPIQEIQNFI